MPDIDCAIAITCPGSDDPLSNYSSETADVASYTAVVYPITDSEPAIGPGVGPDGYNVPNTPASYQAQGCISTCVAVTQELANLCAQQQALICSTSGGGGGGGGNTQTKYYYNTARTFTATCPDGSTSSYTVPAGMFVKLSQTQADAAAQSYGQQKAQESLMCISGMGVADYPERIPLCSGQMYFNIFKISVSGGVDSWTETIQGSTVVHVAPFIWEITSGSLCGFDLGYADPRTTFINGQCDTPGYYTFTLKATEEKNAANPNPRSVSKTFNVGVLGITNASLATAVKGVAYSETIAATGGTLPYTFSATGLPIGLSMTTAGVISGTPLSVGTYSVTVKVKNGLTSYTDAYGVWLITPRECEKVFIMDVVNPTVYCPDWSTIVWDVVSAQFGDSASMSASGINVSMALTGAADGSSSAVAQLHGSLLYTGPGAMCQVTVSYCAVVDPAQFWIVILQDSVTILSGSVTTSGAIVFTFPVSAGTNSIIEVTGGLGTNVIGIGFAGSFDPPAFPPGQLNVTFKLG